MEDRNQSESGVLHGENIVLGLADQSLSSPAVGHCGRNVWWRGEKNNNLKLIYFGASSCSQRSGGLLQKGRIDTLALQTRLSHSQHPHTTDYRSNTIH